MPPSPMMTTFAFSGNSAIARDSEVILRQTIGRRGARLQPVCDISKRPRDSPLAEQRERWPHRESRFFYDVSLYPRTPSKRGFQIVDQQHRHAGDEHVVEAIVGQREAGEFSERADRQREQQPVLARGDEFAETVKQRPAGQEQRKDRWPVVMDQRHHDAAHIALGHRRQREVGMEIGHRLLDLHAGEVEMRPPAGMMAESARSRRRRQATPRR